MWQQQARSMQRAARNVTTPASIACARCSDEDASCASAPETMEIVFLWAYAWNPEPEILNPENLDLEGFGTRSMRELHGNF